MNIPPKDPEPARGNLGSAIQSALQALSSSPYIELINKAFSSPLESLRAYLSDERVSNVYDLIGCDNRAIKIKAAKRLAQLMFPPPLDKVTKATARLRARQLGMPLDQYLREAIYPDALLLAASNIVRPQMAPRLGGRYWVTNDAGKRVITTARDIYDDESTHWLYQEAVKACRAIVLEQPYPDEDALSRAIDDTDGSYADKALTAESIQKQLATDSADRQLDKLLPYVSRKERALLDEAKRRDGDVMAVLLECGYSRKTAHKKRERWRNAVKY